MTRMRLPVLVENGSRLDWPRARYQVEVLLKADQAQITHTLSDAAELDGLVSSGAAVWTTELRCPRTLLSRQEPSMSAEQLIDLEAADVVGDAYLIPGLVAAHDLEMSATGLNPFVWQGILEVSVPAGWWLVRGDPRATTPLTASLIRFRRDPDGWLDPGQMAVQEESDGGKPYFEITLAEDLYDAQREDRNVQIAGLIAACGLFPRSSMSKDGINAEHPVAMQLRARFEDADLDWDSEDFDPARAATVLEAFEVIQLEGSE